MKQLLFVATLICSFAANAASFSFTGNFIQDSDHQIFKFTVTDETDVLIRTFGYAGGTNAAGNMIPNTGFDPMIALFDSTGTMIEWNDDCTANLDNDCSDVNEDYDFVSMDFLKADSLIEFELEEGDYFVGLGLYGQDFSQFPSLSEIIWTGGVEFDGRNDFWALDISGEHVSSASLQNPSEVPVPAAVWLFGSALAGIFRLKRKSA